MTLALQSVSTIRLNDAGRHLEELTSHLSEHGMVAERIGSGMRFFIPNAVASLSLTGDGLRIAAEAGDDEALASVKYIFASHLGEMARGDRPEIWWEGDGNPLANLPNFRLMTVRTTRDITPRMRRVTLAGDRLNRFDTTAALHAKLMVPTNGGDVIWPELASTGLIDWGPAERRPAIRKYTIRRIDVQNGELDIDFVLHSDGGPGASFAERAEVGDVVGLMGLGGGSAPIAPFNLFAGDETALPAIARLIEAPPVGARARAVVEIASSSEIQPIDTEADVDFEWLVRKSESSKLADVAAAMVWPDEPNIFAWAGAEFDTFKRLPWDWRNRRSLPKNRHLAVSYWRRGEAQR